MKLKRILPGLMSIALCGVMLLTGCNKPTEGKSDAGQKSGEKPTLKFMITGAGVWEDKLNPIIEKFEKDTGIKIETQYYEHTQYFPALEAKMNAKSSDLDILGVDVPMTAGYVEKNYIVPLDKYFTKDEINEFVPAAIKGGSWKDKFYSAPMNTSSQALFYNESLLKEAGITMPEPDPDKRVTWTELMQLADKALKVVDPDRTKGINGIVFEQVNTAYQMLALPNSLGEKSIGDDGFTVEGIIDTPGWIEAMTFYHDLFAKGYAPRGVGSYENQAAFTSGKTLFFIGGIWCTNVKYADGFKWNYTYCPTFEGHEKTVATPTGSWHLGVSNYSEHQDEAAQFVKYLTLGEGNDMWLKNNGDVPARVSVAEAYMKDEAYADFPKSIQRIAAYESGHTAVPRPVTPAYSEYETVLNETLADISNGADPAEALKNCVEKANAVMAKYK